MEIFPLVHLDVVLMIQICTRYDEPRVHNKYARTAPYSAIYVGRGSPWGNPFHIGIDGDRNVVIDRFAREILPSLDLKPLRGKHLVCFCFPLRCHADVLLREANK